MYNKIRALSPLPCAKTTICGEVYKIHAATVSANGGKYGKAGEIVNSDGKLVIACGDGAVEITVIQAPSKRAVGVKDFLLGHKLDAGVICGE